MSKRKNTKPIPKGAQLRWLIRLEHDEPSVTPFWAVRPYVRLPDNRRRIGRLIGYYAHRDLTAAHNRARIEAATYYGGTR